MITKFERVKSYCEKIGREFTRYECEEYFRNEFLPEPKERISGESVNKYLRILCADNVIRHPESKEVLGELDLHSYELVK